MGIAPSCGLNRDDGKRKSGSESATEKQQRSFQLSAVVGGKGLWVAAWKKAADFCRYSYLRATIGSTRIARRAGIYVARKATTTNPSDAMPIDFCINNGIIGTGGIRLCPDRVEALIYWKIGASGLWLC